MLELQAVNPRLGTGDMFSPSLVDLRTVLRSGKLDQVDFCTTWRLTASKARLEGNLTALRLLLALLEKSAAFDTSSGQLIYHEYSGSLSLIDGLFDRARYHFERQLHLAQISARPQELALANLHLARIALYEFKLYEVEEALQEAGRWAGAVGDPELVVKVLNRQAELASYWHRTPQSLEKATKALELARRHALPLEEAFALNWLGINCIYEREWERAESYLSKATFLRQKHSDVLGRAETLAYLSKLYAKRSEFGLARGCMEGSLAIVQQLKDRPSMALVFTLMAKLLVDDGQPRQALAWARQSLELRLELGELHRLAEAFRGLGEVYAALQEQELALACHLRVLELYEPGSVTPLWIDLLVGTGDYLLDMRTGVLTQQWEEGLRSYRLALIIIEKNAELHYLAPTLGRMGHALQKLGGVQGLHEAVRCYRLQLRLLGDISSSTFSVSDAIEQRAQALMGLQICNSLLRRTA